MHLSRGLFTGGRAATRKEDIVILSLLLTLAAAQAYGPDTCISGYVWREAVPDDHVCVTPAVRAEARADNAQARYRVSATIHHSGPDTCRNGYVWREATPSDHVCVLPRVRDQTRADNAAAPSRYVSQ
ncbi:hypothetical protein U1839_25260 [Sphingomonas sp. RT2P30]|uniref:hypothetical protein n=1 Tax=Parasphingomonas halimpatiens TaxID=3096162 RepID=UPI002FC5E451